MADIGLKLNNRGIYIIEALISLTLIGVLAMSLQYFSVSTFSNIKLMRTEAFSKVFNSNIATIFNSAQICFNSLSPLNPLANGDILANIRNRTNSANLVAMPLAGLNSGEVTLASMQVANLVQNPPGFIRFNLAVTFQFVNLAPAQEIVRLIAMQGTVDAGGNVLSCQAGRGFNPDNLFIRLGTAAIPIDETKVGNLRINGNLEFLGTGGNPLRLFANPVATPPALPASATTILIPSDETLKENIEPIFFTDGGQESLSAYRFNYISQKESEIGFIAQEVNEIYPNSVMRTSSGQLAVNYNSVLPHLWEYHKKVYIEKVELETRIEKLEDQFRQFEKK